VSLTRITLLYKLFDISLIPGQKHVLFHVSILPFCPLVPLSRRPMEYAQHAVSHLPGVPRVHIVGRLADREICSFDRILTFVWGLSLSRPSSSLRVLLLGLGPSPVIGNRYPFMPFVLNDNSPFLPLELSLAMSGVKPGHFIRDKASACLSFVPGTS